MHWTAIAFLFIAALITAFVALYMSGWNLSVAAILLDIVILSPYVALGLIVKRFGSKTQGHAVAGILAALLVLIFSTFMYVGSIVPPLSSTAGLIFVFAPAYLLVGGIVVYFVAAFALNRFIHRNDT